MKKIVSLDQALAVCHSGISLMIGGYNNCGVPNVLVDALIKKNTSNLTLISSELGCPDQGIGKLVAHRLLTKAIVSYIGNNSQASDQMMAGELEVEFVPQGTLAERIRCGGCGLGGVLIPTGLGTIVETDKEILTLNQKKYILESPLRADVALIRAWKSDLNGNLVFKGSARNFNPLMAMAADIVIVQADNIVEIGEIDPDTVISPGLLVDMIVPTAEQFIHCIR